MSVQGTTGTTPGGEPLNATASMEIFMTGLEKSLGRSLKPLEQVSKQIGGSKFGKNAKALGGALKGMAGASVQAWAMEQVMKLIEPFMKLLELFEIPLNVLAALFSVFVNEIFVQLLPFFLEFSQILIDLMPIFQFLGEIVGVVLVWSLENSIKWIQFIIIIWKEIGAFLGEKFGPAFEKIKGIFVVIGEFLAKTFGPLWEGIKTLFAEVKKAWEDSGGKIFGEDGFIAKGFEALLGFGKTIVNWFIGGINRVIGIINDIPGVDISTIPLLREGGFTTGTGLAVLHPNEFVVPLEKAPMMGKDPELLSAMEEQNRLTGILIRQRRDELEWRL